MITASKLFLKILSDNRSFAQREGAGICNCTSRVSLLRSGSSSFLWEELQFGLVHQLSGYTFPMLLNVM